MTAVLFDYGLTLVTYARPDGPLLTADTKAAALLRTVSGPVLDPVELIRSMHDHVDAAIAARVATEDPREIDVPSAYAAACADLGVPLPADIRDEVVRLEQEAWWQGIRVAPDTVPVLTAVARAGIRVGLCSNAPYRAASLHGQLAYLGLAELFDGVVFSSEIGWRKPAPQIFGAALAAIGAEPATTVMVGDRVREDIGGARALGIRAVRLREHADDPDPDQLASATIDRLGDLLPLLGLGPARERSELHV